MYLGKYKLQKKGLKDYFNFSFLKNMDSTTKNRVTNVVIAVLVIIAVVAAVFLVGTVISSEMSSSTTEQPTTPPTWKEPTVEPTVQQPTTTPTWKEPTVEPTVQQPTTNTPTWTEPPKSTGSDVSTSTKVIDLRENSPSYGKVVETITEPDGTVIDLRNVEEKTESSTVDNGDTDGLVPPPGGW